MAQKTLLNGTPENLIREYYQVLLKHNIPVEQMILFGSYAKDTAKSWSDLGVCVVSKTFGKKPFDELVMLKKLTSTVESLIEPHPFSPQDLQEKYDSLVYEIRTHGKRII